METESIGALYASICDATAVDETTEVNLYYFLKISLEIILNSEYYVKRVFWS
jgi:hypothetical protein